ARVASLPRLAREVRFVSIDFERDSLESVLAAAGHDAGVRTIWIWEGVTPYLGLDAVRATLGVVGRRSAPGSRLAVTYATLQGTTTLSSFLGVALRGFRIIGEPLIGLISAAAMHEELERVDLHVLRDTAPAD